MRQQLLLMLLIVPIIYADSCNQYNTCRQCDSAVDSDGSQMCSWCSHTLKCVSISGLECVFGNKISDIYDCPIEVSNGYEYEESFAKKMMGISGAAYTSKPNECLKNIIHGATLKKQVTVQCDSEDDDCSGFVGLSSYYKAIILSFRGTDGFTQLVVEAAESVFSKKVSVIGGGKVSKYFYDAFNSVWSGGMMAEVLSLRSAYPSYELWVLFTPLQIVCNI
ncbi:unnamed protein product [Enterobius vermicularis]|uniref:Lipase_3 domain-containing protein n=1 Tax=Enterobius vermicularis TaxID=51028 RepID=A0A0N4UYI0_ENTVE|nr:unnamed protein product [Enterobius vermicularis]